MSEPASKGLLRLTAFRTGLLIGLGVSVALMGLAYAGYRAVVGPVGGYNVDVASAGAALTQAGARQLEVRTTYGLVMRQVCNDACDDLSFREDVGDNAYRVAILDAKGACLSCDDGLYITRGLNTVARFDIREGAAPLVQAGHYQPQPDGSLKLMPAPAK